MSRNLIWGVGRIFFCLGGGVCVCVCGRGVGVWGVGGGVGGGGVGVGGGVGCGGVGVGWGARGYWKHVVGFPTGNSVLIIISNYVIMYIECFESQFSQ